MRQKLLGRLIVALCLMAVMIAILLGVGVWMYVSVQPQQPAATAHPATTNDDLTTREDFQPDRTRLLQSYDGVLTDASGREVTLESLRGRPTVILFWSSWCGDCKEYFAGQFTDALAAAEAAGARFLLAAREGVREETRATAEVCLAERGINCGTLMDPQATLFAQLGLRSVPSMAFFNAEGVLLHATADMPDGEEMAAMLAYTQGDAQQQSEQLLRSLMQAGGVASSCMVEHDRVKPGNTVLSETQGLMMHYALGLGDQQLFNALLAYIRNSMTRSGLCAWQTDNGRMAQVNASLDDLRVADALLQAEQQWGGYAQELAYRERALYARCVKDGYLRDFADLDTGAASADVTLCYQDVGAMRSLAELRPDWADVAQKGQELLSGGIISTEFPLYWPRYDVAKGTYYGDLLQMNEAMVTVLHAVRAGVAQPATLDWLEERLREGFIAAAYTPDGQVAAGYAFESTATYALLVQIGLESGREDMARLAMQEMERMRSFTAPLVGGYGSTDGALLYTFDVAQALLAWQQWNLR